MLGAESAASTPVAAAAVNKVATGRRTTGRKPIAAETPVANDAENQSEYGSPMALKLFQDVIGSARRRAVSKDGKSATNSPAVAVLSPRRAFGDVTNGTPVQQEVSTSRGFQRCLEPCKPILKTVSSLENWNVVSAVLIELGTAFLIGVGAVIFVIFYVQVRFAFGIGLRGHQ